MNKTVVNRPINKVMRLQPSEYGGRGEERSERKPLHSLSTINMALNETETENDEFPKFCTRLNGISRVSNRYIEYKTESDLFVDSFCPNGYQCVDILQGQYAQLTDTGLCVACTDNQYCPQRTIGRLSDLQTDNLCPKGKTCSKAGDLYECPNGHICEKNEIISCFDLREKTKKELMLGDIFAGYICPEGSYEMLPCQAGYYCPDPITMIECPTGYFCPPITNDYKIFRCRNCGARSTVWQVPLTFILSYVVLIVFATIIIFISLRMRKRREDRKYSSQCDTDILSTSVEESDLISNLTIDVENDQSSDRLNRELENILEDLNNGGCFEKNDVRTFVSNNTPVNAGEFDCSTFFRIISCHGVRAITVQHLNLALKFSDSKLFRFMKIFNKICGNQHCNGMVTRYAFEKYFVIALECLQYAEPTDACALDLFDELDVNSTGSISLSSLIESKLQIFLDESHICALYKQMQDEHITKRTLHEIRILPIDVEAGKHDNKLLGAAQTSAMSKLGYELELLREAEITRESFTKVYPNLLRKLFSPRYENQSTINASTSLDQHISVKSNALSIKFENLHVSINQGERTRLILNNISGVLEAGRMTAIMGSSGSGKTTMLNALRGCRINGSVSGNIFWEGPTCDDLCVGFVPQEDILYSDLTVRENLYFAGLFRLKRKTSLKDIACIVEETLAKMNLNHISDSVVGNLSRQGISGGERKRTSIGLELMAKPQILFLDEPTSGLDSFSAISVIHAIKKIVERGNITVIASIHQPRTSIFFSFDKLFLLHQGNLVYSGDTTGVENFFKGMNFDRPYEDSVADWIIDMSTRIGENCKTIFEREHRSLDEISQSKTINLSNVYVRLNNGIESFHYNCYVNCKDFIEQVHAQLARNFIIGYRNLRSKVIDSLLILSSSIATALLYGPVHYVYKNSSSSIPFAVASISDISKMIDASIDLVRYSNRASVAILFFFLQIGVTFGTLQAIATTKFLSERRLQFRREVISGYSVSAYFCAASITCLLEQGFQAILVAISVYTLRGSITSLSHYIIQFSCLSWIVCSWALLFSVVIAPKNLLVVTGFFTTFNSLCLSGCMDPVKYDYIYSKQIVALVSSFFSPTRYFVEGMVVGELRCLPSHYGFTIDSYGINYPFEKTGIFRMSLAQWDRSATNRSCGGWYWGVLPSVFVGLCIRCTACFVLCYANETFSFRKSKITGALVGLSLILLYAVTIFLIISHDRG